MEIKHKAKDLNGNWIYGLHEQNILGGNVHYYIRPLGESHIQVDPKTVCVYTGLKDSIDADIYENDLIHISYNYIGIITNIFENGGFNISRYSKDPNKRTVTGNIHD